tara:strand:+ start:150 stop:338 length:189 start_codon:yes stop_codon:yes gene_type:complete
MNIEYVYSVFIPPGTTIPVTKTQTFSTIPNEELPPKEQVYDFSLHGLCQYVQCIKEIVKYIN